MQIHGITESEDEEDVFKERAALSQSLKSSLRSDFNWLDLGSEVREALEVIMDKTSRIIYRPNKQETWKSIERYANLMADICSKPSIGKKSESPAGKEFESPLE